MTNEARVYRANVSCVGSAGVPFRRKLACVGKTKDHAAIDALRRVWRMWPNLQGAQVGGIVWLKDGI
jgi:hypothetical protein